MPASESMRKRKTCVWGVVLGYLFGLFGVVVGGGWCQVLGGRYLGGGGLGLAVSVLCIIVHMWLCHTHTPQANQTKPNQTQPLSHPPTLCFMGV